MFLYFFSPWVHKISIYGSLYASIWVTSPFLPFITFLTYHYLCLCVYGFKRSQLGGAYVSVLSCRSWKENRWMSEEFVSVHNFFFLFVPVFSYPSDPQWLIWIVLPEYKSNSEASGGEDFGQMDFMIAEMKGAQCSRTIAGVLSATRDLSMGHLD